MKVSVAVIGGGISGLTSAFYLNRCAPYFIDKLYLFEKSDHLGGQIRSTRFPDGSVHEHGPRSIRPTSFNGAATLQLVEELGLEKYVLPIDRKHPSSKNRLILVNNRLHPLPKGFRALFQTKAPFTRPLGLALLQDLLTDRVMVEDDSVYNFACRRLGLEVAEYAIDPLCRGVVAGDAREISVKTLMKPMFEAEQQHGSIVRGMLSNFFGTLSFSGTPDLDSHLARKAKREKWSMWSLDGGLQRLPDSISSSLHSTGVEILLNSPCTNIKFLPDKVQISSGEDKYNVDYVFAAIPAKNLSTMLEQQHPKLAKLLSQIYSVNVGLVNLEYPGHLLPYQAFGFLVPSNQKCDILGTIFDSCNFSHLMGKGLPKTQLTVLMGGRWFEALFGDAAKADSDKLLHVATHAMRQYLGMPPDPTKHQVLVQRDCLPQYTVGHSNRLKEIREYLDKSTLPMTLIGASYDGVSINDCIYYSHQGVLQWSSLMHRALGEFLTSTQLKEMKARATTS